MISFIRSADSKYDDEPGGDGGDHQDPGQGDHARPPQDPAHYARRSSMKYASVKVYIDTVSL